jgi:hypothetical protein
VKEERSEWTANQHLAAVKNKPAKGHYLMRDGRKLSGPHTPEQAVKNYKAMPDSKGVKIVHVKEAEDKYSAAAAKVVQLARKKVKGNRHVDTKPALNIQDKGTHGPIESTPEGETNAKV